MLEINKNNGVKSPKRIKIKVTGVLPVINPKADNRPYKPAPEWQTGKGGDKMDCVTVSSGGCIETNLNILMQIGTGNIFKYKEWLTKNGFIGDDGIVRISTRWAAIQNGTNHTGNSGQRVADWWYKNGFIPETMLPNDQSLTWDEFYDTSCITDEMRKIAEESKKLFRVNAKWIGGSDKEVNANLQYGAIQILTPVCPGWNTQDPIQACKQPVEHATELLHVQDSGIKDIYDSYDPFNKQLAKDYPIPFKMLYWVELI